MRIGMILIIFMSSWGGVLNIAVDAPEFDITDNRLVVEDCSYINTPGAPNVPTKTVTIAVPPGAIVQDVRFDGVRQECGTVELSAAKPSLPLTDGEAVRDIEKLFRDRRSKYYHSDETYPKDYGFLLARGGLRRYTLVTVVLHHFGYNPVSKKLYYAPEINVTVHYRMPEPESERAKFWEGLKDDVTFDNYAEKIIYNWEEAKRWYDTDNPKRANEYLIIVPNSLQNSVDALVNYRQLTGYDVSIVTTEYIDANVAGDDMPQKIRNYLRQNLADIEYVLLVGDFYSTDWRLTVPFNDDPDSPWNHPDYSPIPADLYYAELTDHDTISWNYDRDTYYGEVFTESLTPEGDDRPDYHADLHLGRIPLGTQSLIEDVCDKIVLFDGNTEHSYKTAALLSGGIYYYANEDNSGRPRLDGAEFMEDLMNDGVINRANAAYLYEKAGLAPCTYPCTDSLCNANQIAYWQRRAIMYETHHGQWDRYARKVWAWDNGNGYPDYFEINWPNTLTTSDVYQLDNDYPATTFLRSCLCSKPEVYGLGAQLLHHGSSGVIGASRVCWYSSADPGGIPYHWYDYLLSDTTASRGLFGDSYDIARNDLMDASGFWIIAYHYNLFGDPATKQYGRTVEVAEEVGSGIGRPSLSIYPNPATHAVTIEFQSAAVGKVELDVFDESGRFVQKLYSGRLKGKKKILARLPAGVYFVQYSDGTITEIKKFVVIK